MINYQTITIDLQPDYREPVVQMYLSERDVGRPIQVNVLMQGQPYSFTAGTTVHIDLRKPSGHVVQVNGNYAVGSNVVLFNVVEQMAAEPGMCLTELSIVGDGQDPIGSKNWLTKVELSPMHAGDPSETWIEDLDELVQDAMEGHIDATLSIEGDAADAKAAGDAIAAAVERIPAVDDTLTVSGAAADAAATGTELADLKSALSDIQYRMQPIDGEVVKNLVIGTIDFSGSAPVWITSGTVASKRVITAPGYYIYLKKGDKIGLTSYANLRFSIGYYLDDAPNTFVTKQTRAADFVVPGDGKFIVRINRAKDEAVLSSVDELGQYLFITVNDTAIGAIAKHDNYFSALDSAGVMPVYERGNISISTGANDDENSATLRVRSKAISTDKLNRIKGTNQFAVFLYGENSAYLGYIDWSTGVSINDILAVSNAVKTVRVLIKPVDGKQVADVYALAKTVEIRYREDTYSPQIEDEATVFFEPGNITLQGVPENNYLALRMRTRDYIPIDKITALYGFLGTGGIRYSLRYYTSSLSYAARTDWLTGAFDVEAVAAQNSSYSFIKIVLSYSPEASVDNPADLLSKFTISAKSARNAVKNKISPNNKLGNVSIRCAKEIAYTDGTPPKIDYYLLEEPATNRFYFSKNLIDKIYAFTFSQPAHLYSFGILDNGDVIAVLDADSIEQYEAKDDANRQNPYVFLSCENWAVQHEVDFGSSLKPCGWLENCGYKVLDDGTAIFCEYTRQSTATSNAWKISGNPLDKNNWIVTQQFLITTTDNSNGFKHCHMVMQDHFTGICYLATGDSDTGAMLFASDDRGSTWDQLLSPDSGDHDHETGFAGGSEKYCRMLSMTFTKDYIYWASDTAVAVNHYVFRAQRDNNGILDYSTVTDWVNIPKVGQAATYGTAYIPEIDALLLIEREDAQELSMPVRLVDLSDGTLYTIGYVYSATGSATSVGFRTRFSEWYPIGGNVHLGFATKAGRYNNATNRNKAFGNTGQSTAYSGQQNINNLILRVGKNGAESYSLVLDTVYV